MISKVYWRAGCLETCKSGLGKRLLSAFRVSAVHFTPPWVYAHRGFESHLFRHKLSQHVAHTTK